ncbi:hypothetical protein GGR50DRAFT_675207 [Xylaria sp. CBS 124048]|nr:hypothetical protein GGR50DRAFT_675207 [Xylaria sp. CBS 124048]
MFACKACLLRSFGAFYGHSGPKSLSTSRYDLRPLVTRSRRRFATATAETSSITKAIHSLVPDSTENYGIQAPTNRRPVEWAARKELQYLQDPYHIANRVSDALKDDNLELASLITRQSSRDANVVVSWNHLIDYHLKNDRLQTAIKLYNEMKKRGQQPNAQTYTIIFRGCANSKHPKSAVSEAVKLYQNMMSVGRIQPNTIHLNATLQVCAKVEDLDSMFSILKASDSPLQSPNNLTYTTILNALRAKADKTPAENDISEALAEEELRKEKENAIRHAKGIWDEVISRWKSGSIFIDEELVCAMGRMLLIGGYHDADAVEGLLQQTMFSPARSVKKKGQDSESKQLAVTTSRPVPARGASAFSFAMPGNNSLSLILEALFKTRKTSKADTYWNLFTVKHRVVPDADNWNQYLKVVYCGKNSGKAAAILQAMPTSMIRNQHLRNGMKTCLRDIFNRSALSNATKILNVMGQVPSTPDVRALRSYLQVGHAFRRSFDKDAKTDYNGAMASWAQQLAVALDKMFGAYQSLAKKCSTDLKHCKTSDLPHLEAERAELVALERRMCAAYDILINEYGVVLTDAQRAQMRYRHAGITRIITDYYDKLYSRPGPT